jgi:hypothetical protein
METYITTNNNVCNKFDSLKTRVVQDISRSRDIDNERRAVVELNKNLLTIRALFARREILRTFLREQMPRPVPRGEENFLNSRFDGGATLLHTSVKQLKYDIVDLMLIYGADANIIENEKTMAHLAAENNDTLLFKILHRHKADFSLWNKDGETPIMVAIALKNKEITKMLYTYQPIHTSSANNETVLHYAARNNYLSAAEVGCDSSRQIDINQQSTTELRTALHIAVQYSNMEIIDVLLKAGARDDWEDRYGRRAYEYIVDDAIYALFSQYGMKFDQNSSVSANNKKTKHTRRVDIFQDIRAVVDDEPQAGCSSQATLNNQTISSDSPSGKKIIYSSVNNTNPPSKKGKFTPSTKRKGQEAASEARDTTQQSGPPKPTTTLQPVAPSSGPPQFEESQHIPPTTTLPVSPYLLQATAPGQLDDKCYIIYNPQLRDDTKLPKITNFGFEPEYKWTEAFPIEPPRPPNYIRPDVENFAPKFEYVMDHPTAYKFHLMHLNLEYSNKLQLANRSWYKRDLYEIYVWERSNLERVLQHAQGVVLKAAFQRRLLGMMRFGPSC